MAKLTMGTEGALALQREIQAELARRGYSSETDPVMAEYITIMVINDKTPDQINNELADLIGPDYDPNFTEWLFAETTKASASVAPPPQQPPPADNRKDPDTRPAAAAGPGANLVQNALSSIQPPTGPSGNRSHAPTLPSASLKRPLSARSPSPSSSQPPKARRTDAPIGPRAMMDRDRLDRPLQSGNAQNGRSLLDRVGGPHNRRGNHHNNGPMMSPAQVSHIQAQIDGITGNVGPRHHPMNGRGGPVPMSPMNGGAAAVNHVAMQEMLAMQMNIMAQMAANMGMISPGGPVAGGFIPNQGNFSPQQAQNGFGPGNVGLGINQQTGFNQQPGFNQQTGFNPQHGHGSPAGGAQGQGHGGQPNQFVSPVTPQPQPPQPQPNPATPAASPPSVPERPSTPSLCKYGSKCTNTQCRFSHPSPVATAESGIVLSTEFCSKGKDCKDAHCTLGHVSPSVVNASQQKPVQPLPPAPAPPQPNSVGTPCKFGLACTRPGCMFTHPPNFRPPQAHHHNPHRYQRDPPSHTTATAVPCRFGASCTRGDCPFQHPKGHVSANMFYRGLGPDAPLVEGYVSPHKSVRFGASAETKTAAAAAAPKENAQQQQPATEKKEEKKKVDAAAAATLGNDKAGEKKTVDVGA